MRKFVVALLLSTVAAAAHATAASAQAPPPCGEVTRTTTLTSDCTGPLVVGASGITVNLGGHTIRCGSPFEGPLDVYLATVGVVIADKANTILRNGQVVRCGTGVRISGGGGHTVIAVNADGNGFCDEGGGPHAPGIVLDRSDANTIRDGSANGNGGGIVMVNGSDRNVVNRQRIDHNCGNAVTVVAASRRNVVTESQIVGTWGFADAVFISDSSETTLRQNRIDDTEYREGGAVGIRAVNGPNTWIRGNVITRSETAGIDVAGASAGTVVRDNTVAENGLQGGCGISVRAAKTTIRGNTASRNGVPYYPFAAGICVHAGATGNVIRENIALDNKDSDLVDENANCDANVWTSNRFGTANQTCIS
jgi:hypothetical protein